MHHLIVAGKSAFVFGSGFVVGIANGGIHQGITMGQMLAGGGGIILGLSILKASSEVGRLRQMVDNHEDRLGRIERNEDKTR